MGEGGRRSSGRGVVVLTTNAPWLWASAWIAPRRSGASTPSRRHSVHVVLAAVGVGVGSPLLMALALQRTTSSHGAVIFALLPMSTSIFAVLRGGERPGRIFWAAALAGGAIVAAFAQQEAHGGITLADAYLLQLRRPMPWKASST